MKNRFSIISVDNIPSGSYEGYYWLSNSTKPVVQKEADIDKSVFKEQPFVVEANFYDKKADISIQVKYIDGRYHVAKIDLQNCDIAPTRYIGHDIGANFLLVEAWEEKQDELLEGMTTKVPSWAAFKGFEN